MARLKSEAQRAPQTREQATALAERFAVVSAEVLEIEADRAGALALVNGEADLKIAPRAAELKELVKQLKPWFAANLDDLTGGKRKSIELGGCMVGYRIGSPKVTYAGGTDQVAVAAMSDHPLAAQILRVSRSLDKPAILRLLGGEQGPALLELGFGSKQTEDFFVDPITPAVDAAATVPA